MKKLLILILAIALFLSGCAQDNKYAYCELLLNLDSDFKEADPKGEFELTLKGGSRTVIALTAAGVTDTAFFNGDIIIAVRRITFSAALDGGIPDTLSQKQLAAYYMSQSGVGGEIFTEGDAPYFKYKKEDGRGNEFLFVVSTYRSLYAYFTLTYLCDSERADELLPKIVGYIGSTAFTQ